MGKARSSTSKTLNSLWEPRTVRALARELADIAADALLVNGGPVRTPNSERIAAKIIRDGRRLDLATLVRRIQRNSLRLSHPRFAAQQVAAPIPAAALVESVVAALNRAWRFGKCRRSRLLSIAI